MKNMIIKILLTLVISNLSLVIAQGQTWKELLDSTDYYTEKQDFQTAINFSLKSLDLARKQLGELDTNVAEIAFGLTFGYWSLGKNDSALIYARLDSSIRVQTQGKENQNYARAALNLGAQYIELSNYDLAEKSYQESLDINRKLLKADHPYLAYSINSLATFFYSRGRYNEAEPLLKEALEMRRRLIKEDNPDLASSINNLAVFYRERGRFKEAEPLLKEGLEISRRLYKGYHPRLASSIINMAIYYEIMGRFEEAEPLLKEGLEMRRHLFKGDHPYLAMSINQMARFYKISGNYKDAEPLFNEALEMYRRIFKGDHTELAVSIISFAEFLGGCGRYTEAETLYKEAMVMNKRIFQGDHPNLANSINVMANFNYEKGLYREAEPLFKEAIEMRRRLYKGDHPELATSINDLANFFYHIGRYSEAESLYKEGLEMFRRLFKGDHPSLSSAINNVAVFYNNVGRYTEAALLYQEVLEMDRRLYKGDHPKLATIINNVALFYNSRDLFEEAEVLHKEALEMYKRLFSKWDHQNLANSIHNLAFFYNRRGRFAEAEKLYKEALEIRRRLFKKDHPYLAESIGELALFYYGHGLRSESVLYSLELMSICYDMLESYFPSLSEKEKEQYFNTFSKYYRFFNNLAVMEYKESPKLIGTMFDNQLITKGMLLSASNKIRSRILSSNDSIVTKLYFKWKDLNEFRAKQFNLSKNELEKKGINLDSLNKLANEYEKQLSINSEDFSKGLDKKVIKWQDVQKTLDKEKAAIELVRFNYYNKKLIDTIYYAALIIKDSSTIPELVLFKNGKELEGKFIELYREQIEKQRKAVHDPDAINATLKELFTQFWAPIQEKLQGIKTVYLSVDGVYNQINLITLINPATGKYLLDEIDLRLVTSTRDLVERRPLNPLLTKERKNTAELFGDPQFDLDSTRYLQFSSNFRSGITRDYYYLGNTLDSITRGSISPLPGTRKEIDDIANSFQKLNWNINKHLGPEALEEALKAVNNPRVLHIATHGKFLKDVERNYGDQRMMGFETQRFVENPLLRSMLLFSGAENTIVGQASSPAQTDDGLLTAYEAQNLNLDNTELVVLSACETGLGEVRNGEGVYGLQRAFQVAGAKSLIMSLWSVSDQATQELMTSFYSKWLSGKTKREAFREAQMELKQKYPGFYYWGAFVMVGE